MQFDITEIFCGLGTLTDPFIRGLRRHGQVRVVAGIEKDPLYLDLFSGLHCEASTATGDFTGFAPEEVSFGCDSPGDVRRILIAGLPCVGASRAGRAKNALASPEVHQHVGHLFIPFLHFLRRHPFDAVIMENVPEYAQSFSAARIREVLSQLGFSVTERVVNPYAEFETPTERRRWILVGSRGFEFRWAYEAKRFNGTLRTFLDAPDAERDRGDEATPEQVAADAKYIGRKAAEGCGFRMRLIDRTSNKCPTICRSYGKRQPSATFVKTDGSYRMIRPGEVARLHRHSREIEDLISKLPATIAYEVLGQGVVAPPFECLGDCLGAAVIGEEAPMAVANDGQLEMAIGL